MHIPADITVETVSLSMVQQGVRERLAKYRLANDDDSVTTASSDAYLEIIKFRGGSFQAYILQCVRNAVCKVIRSRKTYRDYVSEMPEVYDAPAKPTIDPEDYRLSDIEDNLTKTETLIVGMLIAGATFETIEKEFGYTYASRKEIMSRIRRKFVAA